MGLINFHAASPHKTKEPPLKQLFLHPTEKFDPPNLNNPLDVFRIFSPVDSLSGTFDFF
jgi:hypothetical protein